MPFGKKTSAAPAKIPSLGLKKPAGPKISPFKLAKKGKPVGKK